MVFAKGHAILHIVFQNTKRRSWTQYFESYKYTKLVNLVLFTYEKINDFEFQIYVEHEQSFKIDLQDFQSIKW